jgi:hypothetical protein
MNSFDYEMHILRQKEVARQMAKNYPIADALAVRRLANHRRILAGLGSRLVAFGYRLQEVGEFAVLSELPEPLAAVNGGCD